MNDHKYLSTTNLENSMMEILKLKLKLSTHNKIIAALQSKLSFPEIMETIDKTTVKDFFPDPITEQQIDNMCFIRLYSSFESFMGNVLIDLYYMFPESIPNNRKISIESILLWSNTMSVKEYVIDTVAIDNSYTLELWIKTLKDAFGIELDKTPNIAEHLKFLDSVRNLTLHSNGRINSKFILNAPKKITEEYIKDGIFERVELSVDYHQCFVRLHTLLNIMIEFIEEKYKFKKKNLN